jgi:hypothetical protein
MNVKISMDTTQVSRTMRALYSDQVPFATSVAINEVAKTFQGRQALHQRAAFTTRNQGFMDKSVKITQFATKRAIAATIAISPPGGQRTADILAKFETRGTKTPRGRSIAIPAEARRGRTGMIIRSSRPRALHFKLQGTGPKATVYQGDQRTFMIRRPDGSGGIFMRRGSLRDGTRSRDAIGQFNGFVLGSKRKRRGSVVMLYSFARRARIDDRLHFEDNAKRTVAQEWPTAFGRAFENAVKTAR